MLKSLITAMMLFAIPSFATAQQGGGTTSQQGGGTEQERKACSPDVKRFCAEVIDQGELAILSCLQQNRPKLSGACKKVLAVHGQ